MVIPHPGKSSGSDLIRIHNAEKGPNFTVIFLQFAALLSQALPAVDSSTHCCSVVDPNTLNLDPDTGIWPNLDPDRGLYNQL